MEAAAGGGLLAVVKRLLQEMADVNAPFGDECDVTALQAAELGGHVVEQLQSVFRLGFSSMAACCLASWCMCTWFLVPVFNTALSFFAVVLLHSLPSFFI